MGTGSESADPSCGIRGFREVPVPFLFDSLDFTAMKMFLRGEWREGRERFEVRSPYDGDLIATVPQAASA